MQGEVLAVQQAAQVHGVQVHLLLQMRYQD
jgi:hypothetical protein